MDEPAKPRRGPGGKRGKDGKFYPLETPEGRAKAQAGRAAKQYRMNSSVWVGESSLAPNALLGPPLPKQRHAEVTRALQRTNDAVDNVFDFLQRLVRVGTNLLIRAEEGDVLVQSETDIVKEARFAALKFLDKTVPDLLTNANQKATGVTNVFFGAPLARLTQGGASMAIPTVEIEHGSDPSHVQPESLSHSDS